jgi:hypothetical protein
MLPVPESGPSTADRYRQFAEVDARGMSPSYETLALGVADDPAILALIDELPHAKRQVNLVFSAARLRGAPTGDYDAFRQWLRGNWPEVRAVAESHSTQTNEPGRVAALLPILAALPQPLALLEVGASAGLCLYPDRYSYRYGDRARIDPPGGPSPVVLDCVPLGDVPLPNEVPTVVWRAGIDLNPLDVRSAADVAWLEALIWPEHDVRRSRLAAAVEVARQDPPTFVRGDLLERLPDVAAAAPPDATLVVFHTAVLMYLDRDARERFVSLVGELPGHWISNEGVDVTPGVAELLPRPPTDSTSFVVALDGQPKAFAQPHGAAIEWL